MTLKHLRSSTANKRPQPSGMVDGQLAINTASGSPGLFFKDSAGGLVKVGPVHVGTTAPNASVASGGASGNTIGEQWLDISGGVYALKIWDGAAWRSEDGTFVNTAGDTMTGSLTMGSGTTIIFEGATDNGFETTLTVVDPTTDNVVTLPNITGTVITTGDTGTVSSAMIADGAIVDGDINASAAIAGTKIAPNFGTQNITTSGTSTAASFIPTSSTVPTNGVYLAATNSVALSTNASGRLLIDSSGVVTLSRSSSTGSRQLVFNEGYSFYADNTGTGTALNRLWLDTPDQGEVVIGPRAGAAYLYDIRLRSQYTTISPYGVLYTNATLNIANNPSDTITPIIYARQDNALVTDNAFWSLSADAANNLVLYDSSGSNSGGHAFLCGNVEKARIDSSGRLLVGTSLALTNTYLGASAVTPQLQIEGNTGSTSALSITRQTGAAANLILQRGVSGTPVASGDNVGQVSFNGFDGTNYRNAAQIVVQVDNAVGTGDMPGRIVFSTTSDGASSSTERMRITSAGNVLVGTTSTTANGGVLQVSNGITFPATQSACADANTLDDYEEGTFTPTIVGATTAGTGTYTAQVGRYTKIGRAVKFTVYLLWTAHTGTGTMSVSGLPFTATSAANTPASVVTSNITLPVGTICAALISNSTTSVSLYSSPTGGGALALLDLDTAATLYLAGSYEV